ncbi:MAG: hypothetical protein ACLUUO_03445 [Sellimonas intestinalis]
MAKEFCCQLTWNFTVNIKKDYGLEKIVQGVYSKETLEKLRFASFDERFSIVGMLSGKLCEFFRAYCVEDEKTARVSMMHWQPAREKKDLEAVIRERREDYLAKKRAWIFYQEKQRNWRGQFWKNWNPIAVSGN